MTHDAAARLAAIVDSSDDAIYTTTVDGTITSWNRAAERMFGWPGVAAIGRHASVIVPPERRAEDEDVLARVRRGEVVEHVETVRLTKDSQHIDVSVSVAPMRDGAGQIVGMSTIVRDVSERRRLDEARANLAAVVESADEVILSKNLEGIITSWNRSAERVFGWSAAEAIGRHITLIVPDERHGEEQQVLARIRRGERVDSFETIRMAKNRRLVDVAMSVSPVRDSLGHVVGASTIARDITERRHFDETRARLAAIVESSEDVIISKNLDGIITSWNRAAERMFGWPAAEAIGQSIMLIIPADRREEEEGVMARIRRGEQVAHFDTVRRTKNGGFVEVSVTVSPVRDSAGRIVGASKIARDITERRRIEEARTQLLARERLARETAEAANRAKDEFLAVVSHELRTPLNSVFGWARMLQSAPMDEATRDRAVAAIVRGAAAQVRLVEDLLDMSRMATGNMRLDLRLLDLREIVDAALETVRPAAAAKAIEIDSHVEGAPVTVLGAADRLQQVLWNLLINAVKFTPRQGRVYVAVRRADDDAELSVSDSGEGIAADVLPHVFERFRQEDSSSTRAHAGLGLGLALVRHVVEAHGGSVRAESPGKGKGATFVVRLPLAAPPGAAT
jgi:PAS domain S-box-containing protein